MLRDDLRAGAAGYVLKRHPDDLAPAIRRVADGEVWLDPAVAGQVLAEPRIELRIGDQKGNMRAQLEAADGLRDLMDAEDRAPDLTPDEDIELGLKEPLP